MRHLIHGEAFKTHPISERAQQFPAMLGLEERQVLAYLAADLASSTGKIVDLGSYLGGSTCALAEGVRQSGVQWDPADPPVVSYDLFITNQFMVEHSLKDRGLGVGEPFQGVYRELLGENAAMVREVAGDIREEHWTGTPIDLLFVDILWGWDINQHVIREFYTALIPGRSVIAHQDYIYSFYPWLPISMEYFGEKGFVEFGDLAKWSTVIFGVTNAITAEAAAVDFQRDLDLPTKERLLIRSAERFEGYARAVIELSRVVLLLSENRRSDALELFEDIADRYCEDVVVQYHMKMVIANHSLARSELPWRLLKELRLDAIHGPHKPWSTLTQRLKRRNRPRPTVDRAARDHGGRDERYKKSSRHIEAKILQTRTKENQLNKRSDFETSPVARALILVPGNINYFYNLCGRRIADSLANLGIASDVATLADCPDGEYDWCVLSNISEVVASYGEESQGLAALGRVRRRCRSMASCSMDCVQTPWYKRICDLGSKVDADLFLDLGLADQSAWIDAEVESKYRFVLSGLTPTESRRFDNLDDGSHDRHIPWAFVGHMTEARVALLDYLVSEFDPRGFVYVPTLAPYTEVDSPHLNEQQFERVLCHTRHQMWRSHHHHFYLEPERFRTSLLTGGVPIKIVDADLEIPEGAPFGYLMITLDELKAWASNTDYAGLLQRYRSDWRRLPTLTQELRDVLIDAKIISPARGSLAA